MKASRKEGKGLLGDEEDTPPEEPA